MPPVERPDDDTASTTARSVSDQSDMTQTYPLSAADSEVDPEPDPDPDSVPDPDPVRDPDSVPVPVPDSVSVPDSVPVPDPDSVPVPVPVPDPDSVTYPVNNHYTEPDLDDDHNLDSDPADDHHPDPDPDSNHIPDPDNDHHSDPDPEHTDPNPDPDHDTHTEISMDPGKDDICGEEAASSVSEEIDPSKTNLAAAIELISTAVSSASASFINPTFFLGSSTEVSSRKQPTMGSYPPVQTRPKESINEFLPVLLPWCLIFNGRNRSVFVSRHWHSAEVSSVKHSFEGLFRSEWIQNQTAEKWHFFSKFSASNN